ncbi:hypothetical protein NON20_14845 [Synechocystis sp. B12]|nr:hypothetical protein NON20_14845 [Synechocystis sp. B12]
MKNFWFWLTTEIATCCLLALAPAQAETVSQSNTLDGDLRTAIASDSSADWLKLEKVWSSPLRKKRTSILGRHHWSWPRRNPLLSQGKS